nr:hypothetical protein [Anaerosolibacter sp.]
MIQQLAQVDLYFTFLLLWLSLREIFLEKEPWPDWSLPGQGEEMEEDLL